MFAELAGGVPDGICLDAEGAVWIADPLHNAVVRVADGGEVLDRRHDRQGAFACELGGDDGRTLFVCTYDAAASASPSAEPVGRIECPRSRYRDVSTEIVTPVREPSSTATDSAPSTAGGPPRYFALFEPAPGVLLAGTCGRGIARSDRRRCTWSVVGELFEDPTSTPSPPVRMATSTPPPEPPDWPCPRQRSELVGDSIAATPPVSASRVGGAAWPPARRWA